jgi:hypothetical protein
VAVEGEVTHEPGLAPAGSWAQRAQKVRDGLILDARWFIDKMADETDYGVTTDLDGF